MISKILDAHLENDEAQYIIIQIGAAPILGSTDTIEHILLGIRS